MEIKIEKRKRIPDRRKYPFAKLEVGDSFFVPDMPSTTAISGPVSHAQRSLGWKFTRRAENGGVRVWRIE